MLRYNNMQLNIIIKAIYVLNLPYNLILPSFLAKEDLVINKFNNYLVYKEIKTKLIKLT